MNRLFAVLIAVTALAAVAIPAGAAEQPKIKKAYFKVTLEGVQRDKWDNYHQGTGGCDATVASKGSEVVKFRSKPVLIEATDMEGLSNPVLRKAGKDVVIHPFKLSGTIKRQSEINVSNSPPECGGTGGGTIAKDCGTKTFRGLKASVGYWLGTKSKANWLQVQSDGGSANDPFKNCGAGSQGFPHLLQTQTDNKIVGSELPREELFDKSLGKIIVIARGTRVQKGAETYDKASIRWEATFRRIKR